MRGSTRCLRSSDAHLAEDGVLAIEVRLLRVGDEELGLVRVRARVCHGEDAASVELSRSDALAADELGAHRTRAQDERYLEGGSDLVGEGLAPYALAAFA